MIAARYAHTNLIARDWRVLATFYESVFGCRLIPPERDLSGDAVARGSQVPGAALRGVHLLLPGHGPEGPTLEIFTYAPVAEGPPPLANRPGFGHIAFAVSDVGEAVAAVLAAGGSRHGDVVTTSAGSRHVTWVYVRDPEGNLIELQSWSPDHR
jgi:catechol 2,3-dioxygenase-like lactoylglutathione lyase family enzyme